jgi:hypothetical protein
MHKVGEAFKFAHTKKHPAQGSEGNGRKRRSQAADSL